MKVDTWMPLYCGDYLKDTRRLLTVQHGAYFLLIIDYWVNGEPPPDDNAVLAQITGLPMKEWLRHRPVLARLFRIEEGRWNHDRIEAELRAAVEKRTKAEEKARAAAEARYGKQRPEDAPGNAPSTPQASTMQVSKQTPSPSPITPPSLRSGGGPRRSKRAGTTIPPDFTISPAVRDWARKKGYEPYLELHFEQLIDYAKTGTKDGKEVLAIDWDAKLRRCIADDWGKVRENAQRPPRAGVTRIGWRPGSEPDEVLNEAARKVQIDTWRPGETHGQFRARIVAEPGGEELLRPPKKAA